jgi:hypothetical protein
MSDTTEKQPSPDKRERRRERRRKVVDTLKNIVDLVATVAAAVRYVQQTRGK